MKCDNCHRPDTEVVIHMLLPDEAPPPLKYVCRQCIRALGLLKPKGWEESQQ